MESPLWLGHKSHDRSCFNDGNARGARSGLHIREYERREGGGTKTLLTELWHLYIRRVYPDTKRCHPSSEMVRIHGDHVCSPVCGHVFRTLPCSTPLVMSPYEVECKATEDDSAYDRKGNP